MKPLKEDLHVDHMRIIMTIIGSHPQCSCKQIKVYNLTFLALNK